MPSRRSFLSTAAALVASPSLAAQTTVRPTRELARYALAGPQAGLEAIVVEVTVPAGGAAMPHRHPGFVVGYVLEGSMKFAIDHADPIVITEGHTFFEPSGAVHTVGTSARADAPVRFVAFIVAPAGARVVLPA